MLTIRKIGKYQTMRPGQDVSLFEGASCFKGCVFPKQRCFLNHIVAFDNRWTQSCTRLPRYIEQVFQAVFGMMLVFNFHANKY